MQIHNILIHKKVPKHFNIVLLHFLLHFPHELNDHLRIFGKEPALKLGRKKQDYYKSVLFFAFLYNVHKIQLNFAIALHK
jgi:hypothetical protein